MFIECSGVFILSLSLSLSFFLSPMSLSLSPLFYTLLHGIILLPSPPLPSPLKTRGSCCHFTRFLPNDFLCERPTAFVQLRKFFYYQAMLFPFFFFLFSLFFFLAFVVLFSSISYFSPFAASDSIPRPST